MVGVVWPESITGLELVHARPDQLGSDVSPDPCVLASPTRLLLDPIPLLAVQVEDLHARTLDGETARSDLDRGPLGARNILLAVGQLAEHPARQHLLEP